MTDSRSPDEEVILREGPVMVSTTRVVAGQESYAVSNITSVSVRKESAAGLKFMGVVALLIGIPLLFVHQVIVGVCVVAIGLAFIFLTKPTYIVQISSSANERPAWKSKDHAMIDRIVVAINEAIVRRR